MSNTNTPDAKNKLLPVLIIPGFMSSGMDVQASPHKSWLDCRVWINIAALGFESLHSGGALVKNESMRVLSVEQKRRQQKPETELPKVEEEDNSEEFPDDVEAALETILEEDDEMHNFSNDMHSTYKEQMRCKSRWLEHMSLQSVDMMTEREGMKVRPIPSLAGVDYLMPGALTNHVSYVFGPVILALQAVGYNSDGRTNNLDAAPYDWRIPPSHLESRDGYFTKTRATIERMYKENDNTPVVLLCHSLGCRTAHYLLQFALAKENGQEWIDTYIHTYMPVGAPTLGAPKALRALVSGDKMGLDTFLSDEEGLILGRSFGSGAWLLPTVLPDRALPTAFSRREGILRVSLSESSKQKMALQRVMFGREESLPAKLRLVVSCNGETLKTKFLTPTRSHELKLPHVFVFSLPMAANQSMPVDGQLRLVVEELGLGSKKEEKLQSGIYYSFLCWPCRFSIDLFLCLLRCVWKTLTFPCYILCAVAWTTIDVLWWGVDRTAMAAGSGIVLAQSNSLPLRSVLGRNAKTNVTVEKTIMMTNVKKYQERALWSRRGQAREDPIKISVSWTSPHDVSLTEDKELEAACQSPIAECSNGSDLPLSFSGKDKFRQSSGGRLLLREGLHSALRLVDSVYSKDPLGPRSISSLDAPPVKRVKAVYGINLPTEVSAAYKQNSLIDNGKNIQSLQVLDKSANLDSEQFKIKGGIIMETDKTEQVIHGTNEKVLRSGDGTVPYWSLQHCRAWKDKCDVTVDEIEGAEHREILANPTFHSILIDYVRQI